MTKVQHTQAVRKTVFFFGMTVVFLSVFFFIVLPLSARIFDLLPGKSGEAEKDTIPPQTPIIRSLPEATFSGQLTVAGYGEAGTTMTLLNNGDKVQELEADKDGQFTFSNISMSPGEHQLIVVSRKSSGTESQSSPQKVIIDSEPPTLTVSEPADDTNITRKRDQVISVKGQTEAKARANLNGKLLFVDASGGFSGTYQLAEGDNTLTVTVTDASGNQTQKEVKVSFRP